MAKVNLDDNNVELVELSVDKARSSDLDLNDLLETALDNTQAHVFGGDYKEAFLVIRVA